MKSVTIDTGLLLQDQKNFSDAYQEDFWPEIGLEFTVGCCNAQLNTVNFHFMWSNFALRRSNAQQLKLALEGVQT